MKLIKKVLIYSILSVVISLNFFTISPALAKDKSIMDTYDSALGKTVDSHKEDLTSDAIQDGIGGGAFNKQVVALIGYAIDVFIAIGVAIALIGAYKIMVSSKEESSKDGMKMVLFGVLGIVIMVSAKFLANSLVGTGGVIDTGIDDTEGLKGIRFASQFYSKILYPFIKIALYLVVGALFFMTVAKVITYITSTDDAAKKKAGGVIIWTVVGILIIMGAKQVVEAIMGKQELVTKEDATSLDQIGSHATDFGSIPLIAQIVNWVMGLTMLAILILIIIQAYRVFAKPDDPKTRESLKKTILYIIIGVLVIGAAYAISTVLVVNKLQVQGG